MNKLSRLLIGGLTSAALIFGGAGVAQAAPVAPVAPKAAAVKAAAKPANIWSSLFRLVMSVTKHAEQRMRERGITVKQVQDVLGDGKVLSRNKAAGTTTVAKKGLIVVVDTKKGTIVTTYYSNGGYAGGR